MWQSPRGKRVVTHWASMLRWIWSISECNLMIRDSRKRTPMGGSFIRERRGSGPENGVSTRSMSFVRWHSHHKHWPQKTCAVPTADCNSQSMVKVADSGSVNYLNLQMESRFLPSLNHLPVFANALKNSPSLDIVQGHSLSNYLEWMHYREGSKLSKENLTVALLNLT